MRHHSSIDEVFVATKLNLFFNKSNLFVFVKAPKHGCVCEGNLNHVLSYFSFLCNKNVVLRGYRCFYSFSDDWFTKCSEIQNVKFYITAVFISNHLFDEVTPSFMITRLFEFCPESPVCFTDCRNFSENNMLLEGNDQKVPRKVELNQVRFFVHLKANR